MPSFIRSQNPGGTFFFTLVLNLSIVEPGFDLFMHKDACATIAAARGKIPQG
jgi:hypothetical protein